VENFPTILVRRGGETLFQGVLLPHHEHLERLLQKLISEK
jgi:thioredoxin 1